MRLKYVVALVLAQCTVFVSLKNIKMVTVGDLVSTIFGWSRAVGAEEVPSCHINYGIYSMTPCEAILTP